MKHKSDRISVRLNMEKFDILSNPLVVNKIYVIQLLH